tara:strand:- start:701 stop:1684 length:984 start_codon:yes stop_codon:yes gene_type:complete
MKGNNSFEEIWDFLRTCKRVAMTLHSGPDGDSLGSCTALKYVLEREGVKVDLVSGDSLPDSLETFGFVKDVDFTRDISELNGEDYDAFIFLDCGSVEMVSAKKRRDYEFPSKTRVIDIDHHDVNTFYGDFNYVDVDRSSVCSLLIDFFRDRNLEFDAELSRRLIVGLCTDNGFFNHPKDPEDDFEKALFLIRNGVNYRKDVVLPILHNDTLSVKKLQGIVLKNLEIDAENKIAWSTVSLEEYKELKLNRSDIRSGMWVIQSLKGVEAVFFLVEFDDYIKGSLRGRARDISGIAQKFGGGGHKSAAGFTIEGSTLEEAVEKVRAELVK